MPDGLLFCLADGVGGLDAGEVASQKAVDTIVDVVKKSNVKSTSLVGKIRNIFASKTRKDSSELAEIVQEANDAVLEYSRKINKEMATTIVAAQFDRDNVSVATVGDSRAYLLRDGILGQISVDHTLIMDLLLAGTQIDTKVSEINPHAITRALGCQQKVDVDVHQFRRRENDMFLFCSDGLTDMLNDNEIHETLLSSTLSIADTVWKLVKLANNAGGRDNITAIVVEC